MNRTNSLRGGLLAAICCTLVATSTPVAALPVTGLYGEQVAVVNESEAERERAFRQALAAVILKVTGERHWLEHPAVERALNNAQSYVEAIAYSSETVDLPRQESGARNAVGPSNPAIGNPDPDLDYGAMLPRTIEQRYIKVDFSSRRINELLGNANIPVWDSNRPSVLVWMALQDVDGNRSLLTSDINQDIIDVIQSIARQRGLPVIFPVLDIEDRRNLSEDLVWSLDEAAIRRASKRYAANSVLTGRLHFTASGELVGLWQFLFDKEVDVFDGFATELEDYMNAPLDRVTGELARYYAIVPRAVSSATVRLAVEEVSDLEDYSAVIAYIGNLGLVEAVSPRAIDGEQLELELTLLGSTGQFVELIALDRDLLPIQGFQTNQPPVLRYRWTR